MDEMPNCPHVEYCHCYPEEEQQAKSRGETHCVCGETEKALRRWVAGPGNLPPMTPEQREWCRNEIDSVEAHNRDDYDGASDSELAGGVLSAWTDYCRDKGLL